MAFSSLDQEVSAVKVQLPEHLPELNAREWKTFAFDDGTYLFHIPSSSLLQVPQEIYDAVAQDEDSASTIPELNAVKATLPKPIERTFVDQRITAIALNVAETCNLRCVYCYAGDGNYGADTMMAKSTAREVVDFFIKQTKFLHIVFFGGEPVLNFDLIKDTVAYCQTFQDVKFSFSMTTNGTLLGEQHLKFLKDHKFSLTISYDGHGVHAAQRLNKDRVSNSEELVERKLKSLASQLSELQSFQLRGTVMEKHVAKMEEAIVKTLTDLPHAFLATVATQSSKYSLALPVIEEVHRITERVVERLLNERDFDKLRRLKTIWAGVSRINRAERGSMTCGAGVNYLSVSTSGKFYLCHRFTEDPKEQVGDVKTGLNAEKLASYRSHRLTQHAPCNTCWMREVCAGGCFHDNRMANGTSFRPDPKFCKTQDLLLTLAAKVYARLRREAPEVLDGKRVTWRTENA